MSGKATTFRIACLVVLAASIGPEALAQDDPASRTLECVAHAARETDLLEVQQRRLCWAAPDPHAPVACYVEASRTLLFTDAQSIALCRCARSLEPVRCVQALRQRVLLTDPELVAACAAAITGNLRADCTPWP